MTDLKNGSPRSKVREITEEFTKRRRIVYEDLEDAEQSASSALSSGGTATVDTVNDSRPVPVSQGAATGESTAPHCNGCGSSSNSNNNFSNQVTADASVASASKPPSPTGPTGNDGGSPTSDLTPAANRSVRSPGGAAASATTDAAPTSATAANVDRRSTEQPARAVDARTTSRASVQPPDGTTSTDATERRTGQKGRGVSAAAEDRLSHGGGRGAQKSDADPQLAFASLQPKRKFDYFVIPLTNEAALPTISVREEGACVGTPDGRARHNAVAARDAQSDAAASRMGCSSGGGKGPDRTSAGGRSRENRGAGLPADADGNSASAPLRSRSTSGRRLCEQYSTRDPPPDPDRHFADSSFFDRSSAGREKGRDLALPPSPPPPSPVARQRQPQQSSSPPPSPEAKSPPQRCADAESRYPPTSGRCPFDPQPARTRRPVADATAPPRTRRHDFESSSVFAPARARHGRSAAYDDEDDSDGSRRDYAGDEDFFATWNSRSPTARRARAPAAADDGFDGSTPRSWQPRSGAPPRTAWADDASGGGGGLRSERRVAAAAGGGPLGSRDWPPFWTETPALGGQQRCATLQYYCAPPVTADHHPQRTRSDNRAGERDSGEAGGGFASWDRSGYSFFADPPPATAAIAPRLCRSSSWFELDLAASRCGGLWPPPRAWEDAFYSETQEAVRSSIIKSVSRRLA